MSNRSRGQRPQQGGGIMAAIKAAAEQQQAAQQEPEETGIPEPSGTLPSPSRQSLMAHSIEWSWDGEYFTVKAIYDRDTQEYRVLPFCQQDEPYTAEQAKAFGEALLAAWQYQYTWQQHVGEFLVTADTPPLAPYEHQPSVPDVPTVPPVAFERPFLQHHVGVNGEDHDGPAHPCTVCDQLEKAGETDGE